MSAAFRPRGVAPYAILGEDPELIAAPGTLTVTAPPATLTTAIRLNASTGLSVTATSAVLTTQIRLVGAAGAISIVSGLTDISTSQPIAGSATIEIESIYASFTPFTILTASPSSITIFPIPPILNTNESLRASGQVIRFTSPLVLLDTLITLVSTPGALIPITVADPDLVTDINFAAGAQLFVIAPAADLTAYPTLDSAGALVSFNAASANIVTQSNFQSNANSASQVTMQASSAALTTAIRLAGGVTVRIGTAGAVIGGANLIANFAAGNRIDIDTDANLIAPPRPSIDPGRANYCKATGYYQLGNRIYTQIKVGA